MSVKQCVPLVTPSATQDDLTKVRLPSVQPSSIASRKIIAKYTTDNLKARKSFFTTITHLTMRRIAEAFKKSYKGEIVATEHSNLRIQTQGCLIKIKDKTDAIVLPVHAMKLV